MAKQIDLVLQRISFIYVAAFNSNYFMVVPFICCSFCNGRIASRMLCDYEYFLITVLFVKTKKVLVKKLLLPIFAIFSKNMLRLFKNRSRRARVDQNDIKICVLHDTLVFRVYHTIKKSNLQVDYNFYIKIKCFTQKLTKQKEIGFFNIKLNETIEKPKDLCNFLKTLVSIKSPKQIFVLKQMIMLPVLMT